MPRVSLWPKLKIVTGFRLLCELIFLLHPIRLVWVFTPSSSSLQVMDTATLRATSRSAATTAETYVLALLFFAKYFPIHFCAEFPYCQRVKS